VAGIQTFDRKLSNDDVFARGRLAPARCGAERLLLP